MESDVSIGVYSDALVVLATAGLIVPVLRRLGVSPILGYLAAGLVLGPLGLGSFITAFPALYWLTIGDAENVSATTEPTTANGRLIASAYEAFGRGDIPFVLAAMAADVDWIETEAQGVPTAGRSATPNEVLANVFAKVPEYFRSFALRPERWIEAGDDVVVTGRVVATTLAGRGLDAPYAHVFTVHDGKMTRNENHHDTALWVEALAG